MIILHQSIAESRLHIVPFGVKGLLTALLLGCKHGRNEALSVLVIQNDINLFAANGGLFREIVVHLWSIAEVHTEELGEWIDVVAETLLLVVLVNLLILDTLCQRSSS